MQTFKSKLKENITMYVITAIIGLLTIFSDSIAGRIKFELNRTDLRTSHHQELSENLSSFVFESENIAEYFENGWTTPKSLEALVGTYNEAITTLRKKEISTESLLHQFWKEADVKNFQETMALVKAVDAKVHSLTPEALSVIEGNAKTVNTAVTQPIITDLKVINQQLREKSRAFLDSLR